MTDQGIEVNGESADNLKMYGVQVIASDKRKLTLFHYPGNDAGESGYEVCDEVFSDLHHDGFTHQECDCHGDGDVLLPLWPTKKSSVDFCNCLRPHLAKMGFKDCVTVVFIGNDGGHPSSYMSDVRKNDPELEREFTLKFRELISKMRSADSAHSVA